MLIASALHSYCKHVRLLLHAPTSQPPAGLAATTEGINPYTTAGRGFLNGMQVNYLGHWLLTHQLLTGQQQLRKTQASQPMQQTQQPPHSAPNKQHHSSVLGSMAGSGQQSQHGAECGERQGTRVVMLTSMTHSAGRIRFDDLHAKKGYNGFHRYADSKLAILLAVREFAKRMDRQVASITC